MVFHSFKVVQDFVHPQYLHRPTSLLIGGNPMLGFSENVSLLEGPKPPPPIIYKLGLTHMESTVLWP